MAIDPSSIELPTTSIELLMMPMNASEVAYLQALLANISKFKPEEANNPLVVRLRCKIDYLVSVVLLISPEVTDDGRNVAEKRLLMFHKELERQRLLIEQGLETQG